MVLDYFLGAGAAIGLNVELWPQSLLLVLI